MGRWGKLAYAQKNCVAAAGKLMQNAAMVHEGARVGVAVSGGSDSMTLLKVLLIRKAIMPFDIELMALHVNPGFDARAHHALADWLAELGVAAHLELADHGPKAHSEQNRTNSPCFLCCRERRKRLFELCRTYGLTHLALGHNADDLVANFFMNLTLNGRVDGMAASEDFFKGRLKLIRPLLLVDKPTLTKAARQWGLPVADNPCPSSGNTSRDRAMAWAATAWKDNPRVKSNVFNALTGRELDLALKKL